MVRTIVAIVLLTAAVLWLPLWVQIIAFIGGVIFMPYRLGIFVPATLADALYAPHGIAPSGLHYTILAAVLLIVYWAIATKTRVKELYGMERT